MEIPNYIAVFKAALAFTTIESSASMALELIRISHEYKVEKQLNQILYETEYK